MATSTPGQGTSTLATRLHIPDDRAAYQVSHDMFIALKLCSTELERAAATFKTARDQAQVLHLLVDRKGSKTCLENVMNTLSKLATVQQITLAHFRTLYHQSDGGTNPIVDVADNGILQANALGTVFTDLSKRIAADELWPAHHTRPSSSGTQQPAAASSLPSAPISQERTASVNDPSDTPHKKQKPATPPSQPPPPIALPSDPTDPNNKEQVPATSEIAYQDISAEVAARLTAKEARREEQTRHSLRKRKRKSSYATAAEEPVSKKTSAETKAAAAAAAGAIAGTVKKTRTDAAELRVAKHADAVVDADAGAGADNGQKTDHGGKRAAGGVDQDRDEAVAAAQDLTRRARRRQRSSGTVNQSEESGRSKKRARK